MQYFTAFALILSWSATRLECLDRSSNMMSGPLVKLEVWPPIEVGLGRRVILRRIGEPLNLTCMAVHQKNERNLSDYIVDWKVPFPVKDRGTRVEHGQIPNSAWLWFEKLTEEDAGDYRCLAVSPNSVRQPSLSTVIHLSVKSKIGYCAPRWFKCHSSRCIMTRYVCDGMPDCEDGEDESLDAGCGPDPCLGKVYCGQRCLPRAWCCDFGNCSATSQSDHQRFSDMGFLQTTIYTVIGCAMAFMFIVTILVIAICRVHMKRAMNSRCLQQMGNPGHRTRHNVPLYDLDVYLNRAADLNHPGGVTVTYNINNGVQFVGRPVEPPPYSEIASVPPREGPPPPYVSRENLLDPSVSQQITSTLDSNTSSQANIQSLMTDRFINNGSSNVVTRIPSCFQNNPNSTNIGSHVRLGLNTFNLSSNGDDGSNTTFNISDGTAINTSSNSDSSSSGSVDNFVISRNITSHSQNFEPEYTETDLLLSENRGDNHIHNADEAPKIIENQSTFHRLGGNPNIVSISRGTDYADAIFLDLENQNCNHNSGKVSSSNDIMRVRKNVLKSKNLNDNLMSGNSESENSLVEAEYKIFDLNKVGDVGMETNKNGFPPILALSAKISDHIQSCEQILQRGDCKTHLNLNLDSVGESSRNNTINNNAETAIFFPCFVNDDSSLRIDNDLDPNLGCSNTVLQEASGSNLIDQDFVKSNLVKHVVESNLVTNSTTQDFEKNETNTSASVKQSQNCLGKSVQKGNLKIISASDDNLANFKGDAQNVENKNSQCGLAPSNWNEDQSLGVSSVTVGDSPVSYSNLATTLNANVIPEGETETFDSERNTRVTGIQPLVMPLRESFIGVRKDS